MSAGGKPRYFEKGLGRSPTSGSQSFSLADQPPTAAVDQHDRAVVIVRDVDPANWEEASRKLQVQVIKEWAAAEEAADAAFYDGIVHITTSGRD